MKRVKHTPEASTYNSAWTPWDKALNDFAPYSNDTYLWVKGSIDVYLVNSNVENAYDTAPGLGLFVFSKAICEAAHTDALQAEKDEKARQQRALSEKRERITF